MSRYTFVVTPFGYHRVSRTLALSGRHSLEQLHTAIVDAFEFADDHLHAFFLNGHAWDREFGYFSRPDVGQKGTTGTRLDSLDLVQYERFLYLFDYGDEHRFTVRALAIEAGAEEPNEPALIESVGVAPKQYALDESEAVVPEADPAWLDLTKRIRECLAPPEDVEQLAKGALTSTDELTLANELLDRIGDDDAMLDKVAEWSAQNVVGWLIDVPGHLAREDRHTEALALAQRFSRFSFGEVVESSMALWAVALNDRAQALALIESSLRNSPHDAAVMLDLGIALEQLGEADRAERCYREALRFAGTDLGFRKKVIDALVRSLEKRGQSLLIRQLEQSETRWRSRYLATSSLTGVPETVKNSAQKVGRNDPCPCGSSKKYKKCCGATA